MVLLIVSHCCVCCGCCGCCGYDCGCCYRRCRRWEVVLHTYQPFGSVFADRFCNHEWRQSLKQLSTCWQIWGKSYQKASNISQYPVISGHEYVVMSPMSTSSHWVGFLLLGDFEPSPVAVEAVLESSKSRTCAAEQNVTQGLCIFCHLRCKTLFTLSPPQKSARNQ